MNIQELKLKSSEQLITQAEDGIRDGPMSRGLGDVYKRQPQSPLSLLTGLK